MRSVALLLCFFLLFTTASHADRAVDCMRDLPRLAEPPFDASVEMEMNLTPEVMQFITSTDGTLKPFGRLSPRTKQWIKEHKPEYQSDPGALPWDELPFDEKQFLMRRRASPDGFFRNRNIRGTKVRDQVEVVYKSNTVFLGKEYKRGRHTLDTKDFMLPHVEYGDPNHMKDASDVELHFRVRQSAGAAGRDAWTLLEGMKIARNHQHIHMVAKMPVERLRQDPALESLRYADFVRRVNLLAEMNSMLEGTEIFKHSDGVADYFAFLDRADYTSLQTFFLNVARGQSQNTRSRFKMGWVGLSAGNKYDKPGLIGLEYRAIDDISPPELMEATLNGIQHALTHDNLGISAADFKAWQGNGPNRDQVAALVYHGGLVYVTGLTPSQKQNLMTVLRKNEGVKMLTFDWAGDPMFYGKPERIAQVQAAQLTAQIKIGNGHAADRVLHDFVLDSGLYQATVESLNMPGLVRLAQAVPRR